MFNQFVIPAISTHQAMRHFFKTDLQIGILMNFQLAQLDALIADMRKHEKKVFVHLELIKGLSNDEYGAIYLIQNFQVDGIITTKPRVIELCRKRSTFSIMRFFLKDSLSLNQSLDMMKHYQPDAVELLPAIPHMVNLVKPHHDLPIFLGGLIKTPEEVEDAKQSGAVGITTSTEALWK